MGARFVAAFCLVAASLLPGASPPPAFAAPPPRTPCPSDTTGTGHFLHDLAKDEAQRPVREPTGGPDVGLRPETVGEARVLHSPADDAACATLDQAFARERASRYPDGHPHYRLTYFRWRAHYIVVVQTVRSPEWIMMGGSSTHLLDASGTHLRGLAYF